jgi:predicted small metal-binding protein
MAYSLACKDMGGDCPGAFTTQTQEELMEHVQLHAQTAHPDMKLDEAAKQQLQGIIKQS